MKNRVLFTLLVSFAAFSSAFAQSIPNYSFETWSIDTNYLNLAITNPPLLDTSASYDPDFWTTSNSITNGNVFHHKVLVTQSATAHTGASSIRLESDSLDAVINNIPFVGSKAVDFVCPGFAVCGKFPINLSAFVNLGATFNPALLAGAGIPVPGRKASIGGYLKYTPVGGDTAYVVAVLRKGSQVVAQATYKRSTTDAGFTYFEVPFVYESCLVPDTLVYTISSGNPYSISNVVLGTPSGLHKGTILLADSVFVSDTLLSFLLPPIVANDAVSTARNTSVAVHVTANDISCSGGAIAPTVSAQPLYGTATVVGDSIIYTPVAGYLGNDTFYYTARVGSSPASQRAMVVVTVTGTTPAGVIEVSEGRTTVYPNPASAKLHISTTNAAITTLSVYDMLGKLVKSDAVSANTTIDLAGFNDGIYFVRFTGSEGKVISSSRFTVVK